MASSATAAYTDFGSAWSVAAALLLPPAAAALTITACYLVTCGTWRSMSTWRPAFIGATAVVAGYAAAWAHTHTPGTYSSLVVGAAVFVVAQAAPVFSAMYLAGAGRSARASFSSPTNWFVNLSTAAVGAALAEVIVHSNWLALLVVVVVKIVLQRLAQHSELVAEQAVDRETGVLGSAAWSRLADQLMRSTHRWTVVLVEPLDPSHLATVASIAQLVCSDGEPAGRLANDRIALLVKGPRIVARNLALRVQSDLKVLGVPSVVGSGHGDSLGEQMQMADADALIARAMSAAG